MLRKPSDHVYCSNCKKGLHNTPKKERCKGKDCECRCRTHYVDTETGRIFPFGVKPPKPKKEKPKKLKPLPKEILEANKKAEEERKKHEEWVKSLPAMNSTSL